MRKKNGFVFTETILALTITTLIVVSSTVLVATVLKIASRYSGMEQGKILADSALDLIKNKLIFADNVKFNTIDSYDKFFKIEDGALCSETGDLYGKENFTSYPMQITLEAKNYGLIKLHVKILDKDSVVLYDTCTAFKVNSMNKLSKNFGGQIDQPLTNPVIYYMEEDS